MADGENPDVQRARDAIDAALVQAAGLGGLAQLAGSPGDLQRVQGDALAVLLRGLQKSLEHYLREAWDALHA